MSLMGTPLGFLTDRDRSDKGPYQAAEVVDALIEAVCYGLKPTGNQFNIITKRCYVAQAGFHYRLGKLPELTYKIIHSIPEINGGASRIKSTVTWVYKGVQGAEELEFQIRVNAGMGSDAIVGKAERKACAWLWKYLTGSSMPEGDARDVPRLTTGGKPPVEMPKAITEKTAEPIKETPAAAEVVAPDPAPEGTLTVPEALEKAEGEIFNVSGLCVDAKTENKGKKNSPATAYTIMNEDGKEIKISLWGNAIPGLMTDGSQTILACEVFAKIYKSGTYYNAKSVRILA